MTTQEENYDIPHVSDPCGEWNNINVKGIRDLQKEMTRNYVKHGKHPFALNNNSITDLDVWKNKSKNDETTEV